MPERIYAIDFGTSNSLIAVSTASESSEPLLIDSTNEDSTIMKSVLFSPKKDQWYFGSQAITQYESMLGEGRLIRSIKKYLPDPSFERTSIHGKSYSLIQIIAIFLGELRQRANKLIDADVKKVVLGRPAAFSLDAEKDKLAQDRLELAAKEAGFEHIDFCPEPIAAAYEFRTQLTEPKTVLIADFGGGTSDFTILKMSQKAFKDRDVLAIGGVSLAGDAFDGSMMRHMICPFFGSEVTYQLPMGRNHLKIPKTLINKMCSAPDISFLGRSDIMKLLRDAQRWSLDEVEAVKMQRLFTLVEEHLGYKLFSSIEKTKRQISDQNSALFEFDYPGVELEEEILAALYHEKSEEVTKKIMTCLDETIAASGLKAEQIDIVCCTGGTAKIRGLNAALAQRFGDQKLKQHKNFHSVINGLSFRAQSILQEA